MILLRRRALMEGSNEKVQEWKMLKNLVLDEDMRTVTISQDDTPLSITDFILQINGICDATSDQPCSITVGSITFPNVLTLKKDGTDISTDNFWLEVYNVGRIVIGASASGAFGSIVTNGIRQSTRLLLPIEPITSITAQMAAASVKFKAGTQFILYGR